MPNTDKSAGVGSKKEIVDAVHFNSQSGQKVCIPKAT